LANWLRKYCVGVLHISDYAFLCLFSLSDIAAWGQVAAANSRAAHSVSMARAEADRARVDAGECVRETDAYKRGIAKKLESLQVPLLYLALATRASLVFTSCLLSTRLQLANSFYHGSFFLFITASFGNY
jgi:hypothetical protein